MWRSVRQYPTACGRDEGTPGNRSGHFLAIGYHKHMHEYYKAALRGRLPKPNQAGSKTIQIKSHGHPVVLDQSSLCLTIRVLQMLLGKVADVDRKNEDEQTPLLVAAKEGRPRQGTFYSIVWIGFDIHQHKLCMKRRENANIVRSLPFQGLSRDSRARPRGSE